MKLSPKQRFDAYKYALSEFKERLLQQDIYYCFTGMCARLDEWCNLNCITVSTSDDIYMQRFPEFMNRRPNDAGVMWFPLSEEGYMLRVMLLDDCVKEVKKLLRN